MATLRITTSQRYDTFLKDWIESAKQLGHKVSPESKIPLDLAVRFYARGTPGFEHVELLCAQADGGTIILEVLEDSNIQTLAQQNNIRNLIIQPINQCYLANSGKNPATVCTAMQWEPKTLLPQID